MPTHSIRMKFSKTARLDIEKIYKIKREYYQSAMALPQVPNQLTSFSITLLWQDKSCKKILSGFMDFK